MDNITQTEQSEVALIITNSIPILQEAPKVLSNNELIKTKALVVGQNIIAAYNENGLSPELDERALKFLNNIGLAGKKMKEDRSGITQIMDELKKMYTTIESDIDIKKQGTVPFRVQEIRNAYAKKVAEDAEKKRREAELIENKKKEAIEIKSQLTIAYTNQFYDHLSGKKQAITTAFNNITLEKYKEKSTLLKAMTITCSFLPVHANLTIPQRYHSNDEYLYFAAQINEEKSKEFEATYMAEMNLLKDELVEKLPSKLAELEEEKRLADEAAEAKKKAEDEAIERQKQIDKANAAEKERLQKEADQKKIEDDKKQADLKKEQDRLAEEKRIREQKDNERIQKETNDRIAEETQKQDIRAQGEKTMAMFDKEAAIASTTEAPEARQGFSINVLHPVGYTQIFALWFEKVGKNLGIDKLGNTKLDQMKAWAEKEAHKSGTKIDSQFIKYEETYSAVNRK